ITAAAPFRSLEHLLDVAHRELLRMPRVEVLTSIQAHPTLGEQTTDIYSREEQSFILESPPEVLAEVADLCRRYEERFHHLFLVCAQGIGGHEVLRLLRRRLDNPTVTEWETTVRELGRINTLRRRSVGGGGPRPRHPDIQPGPGSHPGPCCMSAQILQDTADAVDATWRR
ncbi:MAG: 2-oxo-4-hydroxy-4-carboxy-5-ureidoimidazoline decarboxylase, partial [Corynebacterium variabile]|uniref:2-oxo-4-hydroxy-4-carboxy-5-ureidoimidazoline decarboxylase n=1 Tax=Corynebacterium variabile TaxID=1727 RepID=UPI002647A0A3